jgi:hypothetical protein
MGHFVQSSPGLRIPGISNGASGVYFLAEFAAEVVVRLPIRVFPFESFFDCP